MTYNLPNDVDGVTYTNNLNTALNTISTAIPTIVAGTGISIIGDTISSTITQGLSTIYGGNDIVISGNDTISFINNTGYITESDTIFGNYPTKANNLSDVVSQQTALNNLTAVASATNEYVLTKDTSSGNAIFKAGGGGGDIHTTQTTVTLTGSVDISTANYASKSFNTSSQNGNPLDCVMASNGFNMYTADVSSHKIYQYTLDTAFDISTASYSGKSFDVSSQLTYPLGLSLSIDGTTMYVINNISFIVYQYTLGTAFDISTASYASKSFNTSSQSTSPAQINFSFDGNEMYINDNTTHKIYQYTLGTAFDISTASYSGKSFSAASQATNAYGFILSSSGMAVYVLDTTTHKIYQYTLGTAFDISTASYASKYFDVSSQSTIPTGLMSSTDISKTYIMDTGSKIIYEYTLTASDTGSAIFSEPFQASNYKNIIIYLNSLNGTASYTFPVAFTNTPQILSQSLTAKVTALSTIAVTITGTTDSGFIELIGY